MSEIGHQDSEYNVDDLVFNYQAGDQEAGQKILEIYGGNPLEKASQSFLVSITKCFALENLTLRIMTQDHL
ncbi:hypothetical protein QO179_24305 [Bacillus stercoris]|nr:hypothetical protein [Bacillus stercoris]